jgi:hypothetical protein
MNNGTESVTYCSMTEKIEIKGQDIWIVIEPHTTNMANVDPKEYFTASFHAVDPETEPAGNLFVDKDRKPVTFSSPVEALEYANEKLLAVY